MTVVYTCAGNAAQGELEAMLTQVQNLEEKVVVVFLCIFCAKEYLLFSDQNLIVCG